MAIYVLDSFYCCRYGAAMFDLPFEPVPDDELEAVLVAALRASGGSMTHETSCWMASVAATHLVNRMHWAGFRVVKGPEGIPLRE